MAPSVSMLGTGAWPACVQPDHRDVARTRDSTQGTDADGADRQRAVHRMYPTVRARRERPHFPAGASPERAAPAWSSNPCR